MEERVLKVLRQNNKEIIEYNGNDLIGDGIIDSFDVINLISDLEEEFGVEISLENEKDFSNKDAIIALIKKMTGQEYCD